MASAKTAARNKRAGIDWELALLKWFRDQGFDTTHLRLKGTEDEGDLVIREDDGTHLVIEAKSCAFQPAFLKEAETERQNYAKHHNLPLDRVDAIVITKQRGKPVDQFVVHTLGLDYFGLGPELES